MRKRLFAAAGILALAFSAAAQQSQADRTLKVKLNYTGSGKVDDGHKIFVFLFDTPDFVSGAGMPFASQTATAKDQTLTFSGISAPEVYIVAAYDPSGGYDGMSGPPPSGSSMGMRQKEGKPDPVKIEAGKTAEVELPFDDSFKMP